MKEKFEFSLNRFLMLLCFISSISYIIIDKCQHGISEPLGTILLVLILVFFFSSFFADKKKKDKILKVWHNWTILQRIILAVTIVADFYLLGLDSIFHLKFGIPFFLGNFLVWLIFFHNSKNNNNE